MNNIYRPGGKDYLYVNDSRTLKVDREYIAYLKLLAQQNSDRKCTMCLHDDIRSHTHEMVNVYPKGMYVCPHSHPFKSETKILIEGKMQVYIFDDDGTIIDKFVMDRDGIFTYRMDKGIIHTNIPLTDVVFHEVTEGPFVGKDDSVFPKWAPKVGDADGIGKYMNQINAVSNC